MYPHSQDILKYHLTHRMGKSFDQFEQVNNLQTEEQVWNETHPIIDHKLIEVVTKLSSNRIHIWACLLLESTPYILTDLK